MGDPYTYHYHMPYGQNRQVRVAPLAKPGEVNIVFVHGIRMKKGGI